MQRYKANQEKHKAAHRAYWKKNRERLKGRQKKYYRENKEKIQAKQLEYDKKNRERSIWRSMIHRCTSPKSIAFHDYGARGISVSPQWLGVAGYHKFLQDIGHRPSEKHTLERINNSGNYEPGNVVWSNRNQQARNRRSNRMVTIGTETKCLNDWTDHFGMPYNIVYNRIHKLKWSPEEALKTPARGIWHKRRSKGKAIR